MEIQLKNWLCLLALTACLCVSLNGGGSGTNTGNGIVVGKVVDILGASVQGVSIQLLPASHDPVRDGKQADSCIAITDESGCFILRAPAEGVYTIEAVYHATGDRAFISAVRVFGHDTVFAPVATVKKPGAINTLLPSQSAAESAYVYLPGTTRFGRIANDAAIIDSVPAGSFPEICYANQGDTTQNRILKTNVTVASGFTAVIANNHAWEFSRNLHINTTISGAAVGGNVCDFPVLVRLSSGNFDFNQAMHDGGDVRFLNAGGSLLPFEIERWDPVMQRAEIWVKIDTVYGYDSTHYFTMIWGDSASTGFPDIPAVFDTGDGYQGVWHLGEPGNTTAKDATGNHYDGTPSDTVPAGADGVIGRCCSFNGTSNFIRINGTAASKLNFGENSAYTVSAWAYADSLDNGAHLIVGKGNEQYFIKFKFSLPADPMVWEFVEYHDKTGWFITNSLPVIPKAKTWTHIVGVRKGTAQYFFVNGELVDSSISLTASPVSRSSRDDVTIGRFYSTPLDSIEGKCAFQGKIDEVRIINLSSSADWVKLCYMNQKERDALISW